MTSAEMKRHTTSNGSLLLGPARLREKIERDGGGGGGGDGVLEESSVDFSLKSKSA